MLCRSDESASNRRSPLSLRSDVPPMTKYERDLQEVLAAAEAELRRVEERRLELTARVAALREEQRQADRLALAESHGIYDAAVVTHHSDEQKKIRLFRSLFRGREDVYPKRFESTRTGMKPYRLVSPGWRRDGSTTGRRVSRRSGRCIHSSSAAAPSLLPAGARHGFLAGSAFGGRR